MKAYRQDFIAIATLVTVGKPARASSSCLKMIVAQSM